MNKQELAAMVAEILSGMEHEPPVKGGDYRPTAPQPEKAPTPYRDGDFVPDVTALDLRKLYLVEHAENEEKFRKMKEKTPARLGSGRAGARYKTLTMLRFRADHAAAQDAVFSQVSEDFAAKNGMVEVRTKCRDKDEYLTRPDLGRCFDEENQQKIRAAVPGTPRVQIVVGDGLSSAAITANAMDCLAAIRDGLKLRGIDPGTPIFVRYCRVGAGDAIGDVTGCELVCMLVGERPGRLRQVLPGGGRGCDRGRDRCQGGVHAGRRAARAGDGQEHVRLYHLPAKDWRFRIRPDGGVQHSRTGHPGGGSRGAHCGADRNDSYKKGLRRGTASGGGSMIPVKVLAVRYLANAAPALCRQLGAPEGYPSLGLLTTDCDDATYIALDAATKAAQVQVAYARSFYAGAANATTPFAGEVIGILAAQTPGAVRSGMEAALAELERVGFEDAAGVPYLAHTVSSVGTFLAKEAGVRPGSALAYLIAPPLEGMYAMDAALKAADVTLCKLYAPPSETNFGDAACGAFADAVAEIAASPVER